MFKGSDVNTDEKGKKIHCKKLKYSAAKLYKKGIVLEIEGLPTKQFKNVQFEISDTIDSGVFEIKARFLGVEMDKVNLVYQDLLQLQDEGVAVIEMFKKAKMDVSLLIKLLNKKFYGRQGK